jgi:hypothetical protein
VPTLRHHGASRGPLLGLAPRVVMTRTDAGADSDTSTARTVAMMGDYIRKCASDPAVMGAAEYARKHFALGSTPAGLAWAVFWYVKHSVKFRQDEATMFRLGYKDEVDFLTAPDVLLRMQDPAEDCDGFTMLVCSMLLALGVPCAIATVAASPDDPNRWSHVFALALLPGGALPLDASHGVGPGWMVPREHISRFQAWDLRGGRIKVQLRNIGHGLHGYVSKRAPNLGSYAARKAWRVHRRGLGDTCYDDLGNAVSCGDDTTQLSQTPTESPYPVLTTPGTTPASSSTATPAPPSSNLALAASLFTTAANDLTRVFGPQTVTTYNPLTGQYTTTTPAGLVSTSATAPPGAGLSSPLLLLGLAVGLGFLIMSGKK